MRPKGRPGSGRGIDGTGWFGKPDGYGKVMAGVKGGSTSTPGWRGTGGSHEVVGRRPGAFVASAEPAKGTRGGASAAWR